MYKKLKNVEIDDLKYIYIIFNYIFIPKIQDDGNVTEIVSL